MASHDPQPSASKDDSGNDYFKHTPLDKTLNCTRLLRILPDLSDTGLIQCELWHSTTDAACTCLSYIWGAEENQETIGINEKWLSCCENLWSFLSVAHINQISEFKVFWIDPICID
ncbi:hypothetical protein G6011_09776 [Alternaria panax]|uniref:Heterokaryon incompatibility domain-containing protein n=1 Tax=Alternaria panax TaxID=48097 RepID=A0AAD4FB35_9PLEO|nr:hypothetical protein G6011_09776 [Alternaria panax]